MREVEGVVVGVGGDGDKCVAFSDVVVGEAALFAAKYEADALAVCSESFAEFAGAHVGAVQVFGGSFLAGASDRPVDGVEGVVEGFCDSCVLEQVFGVGGAGAGDRAVFVGGRVYEDEFVGAEVEAGACAVAEVFVELGLDEDDAEFHVSYALPQTY